jgi:hypothetical protein
VATRVVLPFAAALALGLGVPSMASAAPPSNDNYQSAADLPTFTFASADTSEATVQSNEPVTPASGSHCPPNDTMGNTVWYKVTGSGVPITVNTFGSGFDTMLTVYATDGTGAASATSGPPSLANAGHCNNDAGSFTAGSRISFPTINGKVYLIQAGGWFDGTTADSGTLQILATDALPAGDDRANPIDVTAGSPLSTDNLGGTEASGESLACTTGNIQSPFGSTVWFHYAATAEGTATFTSTGFDTVMQVYRGSDTTPLACNDDGPNQVGPSRVQLAVTPGDYFIQVGGFAGIQDNLTLSTEFVENLDHDGDGYPRPQDCNDNNAAIHPGATDMPDNGVDEDCSGSDAVNLDRDADGYPRPQDCNDSNAAIHPGAADIPDNGIDEDCSGADAVNLDRDGDGFPRPADCNDSNPHIHPGAHDIPGDHVDQDCNGRDAPFPALILKYNFDFSPQGKVLILTAQVKRGAAIRVSCKGRGCPGPKTYHSSGGSMNLKGPFRGLLAGESTVSIRATLRGFVGKVAQLTYHAHKKPTTRVLCIVPGSSRLRTNCG